MQIYFRAIRAFEALRCRHIICYVLLTPFTNLLEVFVDEKIAFTYLANRLSSNFMI